MSRVEIVDRIPLNLKAEYSDATYDVYDKYISLNLKECEKYARQDGTDFYEYVARCINHEVLHHILNIEQNAQTTRDFDNIAEKYMKYWMW